MTYQDIIKRAWVITQEHKYLRAFGTVTSIFFLLIGILRVRYILPEPVGTMQDISQWLHDAEFVDNPTPWLVTYIVLIGIIYIFFFFTHILAEGGLIASIAKIEKRNMTLSFSKTFALGMHFFLPVVEYRAVTALFDVTRFIVMILFFRFYGRVYGFYEDSVIQNMWGLILFAGIVISIMAFFLIYAEYHLIIRKAGIIKSIRKSMTLVTFHFSETLMIAILMSLIIVRALINLLLVFLIPVAIYYLTNFITLQLSSIVAVAIGGTVGLVLFWFAARIAGVLLVFVTAVWTLMYLKIEDQKDYEIFEGDEGDSDAEKYVDPGMI